jgi:hypothetical protein
MTVDTKLTGYGRGCAPQYEAAKEQIFIIVFRRPQVLERLCKQDTVRDMRRALACIYNMYDYKIKLSYKYIIHMHTHTRHTHTHTQTHKHIDTYTRRRRRRIVL